jgi:hypothetical protein
MKGPLQATGNFGDLRDGRFHAGIDYSTFGKVGRPVYAVDDGWVWRVRASGQGYGRSIYLQLRDGRFAVYGHLSRYAPKIDAYVWQRQDSSGEYEQDLQPKPGELAFKRGDIIGWSGESGDGPPHLHFEIRRADMNLHPFCFGFTHADTKPPSLTSVRVVSSESAIGVPERFPPVRVTLDPTRTVRGPVIRGPFTLSAETGDWADGRETKKATYALRAWVDSVLAFEAVLDSFHWDDMPEAELVYDLSVRRPKADDLRALNAPPTLESGVVRRAQPSFDLAPGEHTIEIEAKDEAGNATRATMTLTVAGPEAETRASRAAATVGRTRFPTLFLPGEGGKSISRSGSAVRLPFAFEFPANAVYGATQVETRLLEATPGVPRGLVSLANPFATTRADSYACAVELSPSHAVLRSSYRAAVGAPPGVPGADTLRGMGLYLHRHGDWTFLSSQRDSLGRFVGTTRRLGTFAVLADTTAPKISFVPREKPFEPSADAPPPPLAVRVTDEGSGVAIRDARVVVDGRQVPAEFSQEEKTLTWSPRRALVRGTHFVRIEAVDRAGNRSSVVLPFEVR